MQQIVNFSSDFLNNQNTIFYNMVGNFIPPEWSDLAATRVLSKTARQLLSLIVSRFKQNHCTNSNKDILELQESYYFFEKALRVGQRRVRQCILELEAGGFIRQELKTIIQNYIKCRNMLCINLAKDFRPYCGEKTSFVKEVAVPPPSPQFVSSLPQNISCEAERNLESTRKDFQLHNIIDNNISILESRYRSSDFVDKNVDNSSDYSSFVMAPASESKKIQQEALNQKDDAEGTGILGGIASKAKKWFSSKKLEDFHPLSEEDAYILQLRSKRDFSLSYMNKLLIKLSTKYPNHKFHGKSSVINYMTKALANEMRQALMVNNESFSFKADNELVKQEKYLREVENTTDASQHAQLCRKIAGVFDRETAYTLLTSCRFLRINVESFRIEQVNGFKMTEFIKDKLLKQVQAVYGNPITNLEIMPLKQSDVSFATKTNGLDKLNTASIYGSIAHLNPESIWYKVRKNLIDFYNQFIDQAWFSKLEVEQEDATNKNIVLKPASKFIGDMINERYFTALKAAFAAQGFTFEIAKI